MKQLLLLVTILCIGNAACGQGKNYGPCPSFLMKPVSPLFYCFKEVFAQKNWLDYIYELNFLRLDTTSAIPDTTILYKGEKYYGNPKYLHWPMVGLTLKQIEETCSYWQDTFNAHKAAGGGCNKKFWNKIRRFDPFNQYYLKVYVPSYAEVKAYVANKSFLLPVHFSDTLIGPTNADFSKDSLFTFFLAARYVKRE